MRHVLVLVLVRGRAAADAARESHWYSGDVTSSWSELLLLLLLLLLAGFKAFGFVQRNY